MGRNEEMRAHTVKKRRNPPAPNPKAAVGRGRLQMACQRLAIAVEREISTTEAQRWCGGLRRNVYRALTSVAEPVGRSSTRGRPRLWRVADAVADEQKDE